MHFDLQPNLENEFVKLRPLKSEDFEMLYQVASDPLIWEQHPNKNRYKRDVFEIFFKDAIESGGAFLVINNKSDEAIGSSRYYDFDKDKKSIAVGYTFLARSCWGTTCNNALKTLMLDHAFKFVDKVIFYIGADNIRSQKAIEKLGANKIGQKEITFPGEENPLNFMYAMDKNAWAKFRNK